jgi:predicted RNase H-like HicB family nuclease
MLYDIFIQPHSEGQYQAISLTWPDLNVTGNTEEAALENIRQAINNKLSQGKLIRLKFEETAPQITATTARRRVNRFVISEIGNLLYSGEPNLVLAERLYWQVPIHLAYPETGPVGEVGSLAVDAQTGEVVDDDKKITDIIEYARYLAQRTAVSPA